VDPVQSSYSSRRLDTMAPPSESGAAGPPRRALRAPRTCRVIIAPLGRRPAREGSASAPSRWRRGAGAQRHERGVTTPRRTDPRAPHRPPSRSARIGQDGSATTRSRSAMRTVSLRGERTYSLSLFLRTLIDDAHPGNVASGSYFRNVPIGGAACEPPASLLAGISRWLRDNRPLGPSCGVSRGGWCRASAHAQLVGIRRKDGSAARAGSAEHKRLVRRRARAPPQLQAELLSIASPAVSDTSKSLCRHARRATASSFVAAALVVLLTSSRCGTSRSGSVTSDTSVTMLRSLRPAGRLVTPSLAMNALTIRSVSSAFGTERRCSSRHPGRPVPGQSRRRSARSRVSIRTRSPGSTATGASPSIT
jgi:hypothetical protein